MGAIPMLTTTHGLRSSAFDRHQDQMKKQLLPKDLAARAQKLDPAAVEAEVLRIISAKPAALLPWGNPHGQFQGQIVRQAQAIGQEMNRQARLVEQAYMGGSPPGSFLGFTG